MRRFHLGHEVALVVPGAPPPNEAVLDLTAKGFGLPVALGAGCHRHHVLVGHEQDGLRLGLAAAPGIEQAQVAHHLTLQGGVGFGKPGLQQRVQLLELVGIESRVVQR